MQLSARNRLFGTVVDVVKGDVSAKVSLRVGDSHIVSLITRESCDELNLQPGQHATAMVKATDVMILTSEGDSA